MTHSLKVFKWNNIVLTALFVCGLFFLVGTQAHADQASCIGSGGSWNNSGVGTCTCPAGYTPVNDACVRDGGNNPAVDGTLTNPLSPDTDTIPKFLLKIIDVLLVFALPIIILYIMYAGYLFVTAAGNSEKITTARSALLWSVVGGVIVLGARLIIAVIQGTISGF